MLKRPKSPFPYVFDVYKDARGEWRWRLWAKNGKIVADSGEGYKRRGGAVAACDRLVDGVGSAEVAVEGKVLV